MIRPFVWSLCFFIIGIIAGQSAAMYFALFAVAVSAFLAWYFKSKIPIVFILFFLLGNGLIRNTMSITSETAEQMINQEVTISGTVTKIASTSSGNQKITVKTKSMKTENIEETKSIKIMAISEKEKVSLWDDVELKGVLLPLEQNTIPGGYNEKLYLTTRGYHYKIYVEEQKVTGQTKTPILYQISVFKKRVQEVYDTVLPAEKSGILKAMVTGDKDDIDTMTRQLYSQAGIAHILAVSGLHVSIISMYVFYALEKLLNWSKRKSSAIVLLFLIFYLFFAGFSPSAVRAVIMIAIGLVGNLFYYEGDSFNNIAIAAICILFVQPLYLWDIGFQLSFITITGILIGAEMLEKSELPKWFKNTFGISLVASSVSFPITAYYFYFVSLIGILVNIIVLPLTGFLLGMGMIVGMIGLFSIPAATFLSGTVYYILCFYEKICILAEKIPYGYVLWGRPLIITVILCYLLLFIVYMRKKNPFFYPSIILVQCLLLGSVFSNQLIFKKNKIAFLDVGQGDSIVIQTYDKHAYVVDTGGRAQTPLGRNTGVYTVLPYLQEEGISKIDGLFLTHTDSDHCLGAIELMGNIEIDKIYISNYDFERTPLYETLLKNAEINDIAIFIIGAGDSAELGKDMYLDVLYPYYNMLFLEKNDNHGSFIFRITSNETSFLLTGDAGKEDEAILLQQNVDVKSDILKVGHHGSKYSTSEQFLKAVQPEAAILSYGANNHYNHPHIETVERLQNHNATLYETAKQGTITVSISKNGYTIKGVHES